MSNLIKNTIHIFILSFLMIAFVLYLWPKFAGYQFSHILMFVVGLGFVGSFIELYILKSDIFKNRKFFKVTSYGAQSEILKIVEVLSVRLALKEVPELCIFNDNKLIIRIIYKKSGKVELLLSSKCIEMYSSKELEFAIAVKLSSLKNRSDSSLKIYKGFVGVFWTYPASLVKSIIDIEQSKNGSNNHLLSNSVYLIIACILTLSGGFFAQLYLLFIEYYFDWLNYKQALIITKNKQFHFKHLTSDNFFSGAKLKFYSLLDQLYFDIQARLSR